VNNGVDALQRPVNGHSIANVTTNEFDVITQILWLRTIASMYLWRQTVEHANMMFMAYQKIS